MCRSSLKPSSAEGRSGAADAAVGSADCDDSMFLKNIVVTMIAAVALLTAITARAEEGGGGASFRQIRFKQGDPIGDGIR